MKKENQTQNKKEELYDVEPLKKYIAKNNLTLKQFAKRVGVSEYVVSRIVNHKPLQQLKPIFKIVTFLNLSIDHFLLFDKNRDYVPRK